MSPTALSLALLAAGGLLVAGTVIAQKCARRRLDRLMPHRPARAAAWSIWIGLAAGGGITVLATHLAGLL